MKHEKRQKNFLIVFDKKKEKKKIPKRFVKGFKTFLLQIDSHHTN